MAEPRHRIAGAATRFGRALATAIERAPRTGTDRVTIAAFPMHEADAARRTEADAHRAGRTVCHVGYDRARVVIGPIVTPDGTPCLRCARLWAPVLGRDDGEPSALPMMAIDLIATSVAAFVATPRPASNDDDVSGGGGDATIARVRWFDLETIIPSEHRLAPHPDCERCTALRTPTPPPARLRPRGVPAPAASWRAQPRPDHVRLADRLVDGRFGLVRRFEQETEAIAHSMTFAAFVGRADPRQLEIGVGRTGCTTDDRAVAMLEALERFSSFRPRGPAAAAAVAARYADIAATAIDPRAFILPDAAQQREPGYRLAAFDPDGRYHWVRALSLRRGIDVLVPRQIAYYDIPRAQSGGEQQFVSETSNGCALGSSLEEAALFGLFEVLERDAYLATWYARLVPRRIRIGAQDDLYARGMIARIELAGFSVAILDIGVGLPLPSIAVLATDRRADAPVASIVSTGAHPNPVQALRGALVEVCTRIRHHSPRAVAAAHDRGAAMLRDPSSVTTMDDHATLYGHPDSLDRLAFLTAATDDGRSIAEAFPDAASEGGTIDLGERLAALSAAVLAVADDVLVIDMTNTLTASVGLHCVKVLVPGLLPVTFGHQYRRIGTARLARIDPARPHARDGHDAWLPHNFQ